MRIEHLTEKMNTITNKSGDMVWNPNKTESDWNSRIAKRVGISKQDFFKKVQIAVDRTYSQWHGTKNTCITFYNSRFSMIVNRYNNNIITILDASWGTGSRECKRMFIDESNVNMSEFINGFCNNNMDLPWGTINLTENLNELQIDLKCAKCISVKL